MAQKRGLYARAIDTIKRKHYQRSLLLGAIALLCALAGLVVWRYLYHPSRFEIERSQNDNTQGLDEALVEGQDDGYEQFQQSVQNSQVDSSTEVDIGENSLVIVDVDGAVNNPGVYVLEGSHNRVNDAVTAAGGLSVDADTARINLAAQLEDGSKVYIPHYEEELPAASEMISTSHQDATPSSQTGQSSVSNSGLININSATKEELTALPGVGEATADAIVRDREQNGPFTSIEDIMRVSGIGEKKFEKMRPQICI